MHVTCSKHSNISCKITPHISSSNVKFEIREVDQVFGQMVSMREKTRGNTNLLASCHISCGYTTDLTQVKKIYLGQIHQKFPEVNSSRVLFYLGKKFWEGHTTDIGSQGFHAQLNFLGRKFKKARCSGI